MLTFEGVQLAKTEVKVTLPGTVKIKGSTTEWKNLLVQALGTPYTLVILQHDLDMDLTGYSGIQIAQGVTFTSEAPKVAGQALKAVGEIPHPPARDPRHLGPRLYTTSRAKRLFEIRCNGENIFGDNVRINGFRLHGPDVGTPVGSDNLDVGIKITGCTGIEIANMELAGWSGDAINVQDLYVDDLNLPDPGLISKPDEVKIHDNFFHHNQQKTDGEGYGVAVGHGAYALIERNVFDFNRHAISAGGQDRTGYTARHNLVLKGGGIHCIDGHGIICWDTHQFDVHGTTYCNETLNIYEFGCGQAGEYFEMTDNAFQYTNGNAIKVRGNPTVGALVANNVFAHGGDSDAIKQNVNPGILITGTITNPIEIQSNNRFGIDTYGQYDVCDFDGDGKDDLFLATGVSWWYASGGKMHWTYLKEATERLDQVGLGDFDGDGRCDVFAANRFAKQWEISPGGSGAWTALRGTYDIPFEELGFGDFDGDRITDVFHRAPDGQWSAISPGIYDWTPLQSSKLPLSELRFGHFNDDRITDVIAVQGRHWSVSFSGRGTWEPLNDKLSNSLESVMIGDIDADRIDDILRYTPSEDGLTGTWEISWGGGTDWEPLATLQWVDFPDSPDEPNQRPADGVRSFVGQFNDRGGADLLATDHERKGHIYTNGSAGFSPHSLYAY